MQLLIKHIFKIRLPVDHCKILYFVATWSRKTTVSKNKMATAFLKT